MSSSTSSSERSPQQAGGPRAARGRARALNILAALALLALAMETMTRMVLFHASKDLQRFSAYPERARVLATAPGRRLAFIGNSLTERGVDLAIVRDALKQEAGVEASAEMFVADGSHLTTWRWIVEHEFWKRDLDPDLFVLTFYENGLEDGKPIEIGRLAQFFSDRRDWGELCRRDLTTLEQRAELVVSSSWATFAVRDRIKERVFDLIPGYRTYAARVNGINFRSEREKGSRDGAGRRPATRQALARFLGRARERGAEVLFVAFPTRSDDPAAEAPYDVPAETRRMIADTGMLYLDLRRMPELRPEHYDDDIHLNEAGRRIYSRRFAHELSSLLARAAASTNLAPAPRRR